LEEKICEIALFALKFVFVEESFHDFDVEVTFFELLVRFLDI